MMQIVKAWIWKNQLFLACSLIALVIVGIAINVHTRFWEVNTVGSDTYYSWVEGSRILRGQNPYDRILHGNMEENNKYATYFPLFYEASAVTQYLGLEYYPKWIGFWRYVFLASNMITGLVLFVTLYSKHTWSLSLLALPFWYFNRWNVNASMNVALDFIPICLMVISLVLFGKWRKISLLTFGCSLAFKQIAIFLAPLFLIWEYNETHSIKKVIVAGIWIISVPLLASLPFLLWNHEGFIKSISFSATRNAQNHFGANSIDVFLNMQGLAARIPFLLMLLCTYLAAFQRTVGRYGAAMLVMGIFIAFNSILFAQYPAWLMPLLPLVAGELMIGKTFDD